MRDGTSLRGRQVNQRRAPLRVCRCGRWHRNWRPDTYCPRCLPERRIEQADTISEAIDVKLLDHSIMKLQAHLERERLEREARRQQTIDSLPNGDS